MHVFKDNYKNYIDAGFSVIPDKYKMKTPAIKGWTDYCYKNPTLDEAEGWSNNFTCTNMAVCLGEASGIIALDFDSTDETVIKLLEPILPKSPVGRIGAKGWARLFRFRGETTQSLKYNGEMVIEILSSGKKLTLPPSIHPNGMAYKWETETTLLDVDINELPYLPPMLFSFLEQKLRSNIDDISTNKTGSKIISGRNDGLSSLCGTLIQNGVDVNEAIKQLLDFDETNNSPALFTDINEMQHTERFTNALKFYTNHLDSINTKRMRSNKTYEVPITKHAIDGALKDDMIKKKEQKPENQKLRREILVKEPEGILKNLKEHILSNSFIKQPELALSASLALLSTVIARKFTFLGNAPNLYLLNVAPSGSGKDAPQQCIKRIMIDTGIDNLLGSGDYVSDASLMDSLSYQPVRLDIVDEASGLLSTVNRGGNDYSGKMADILCELYTTSNDKFLGRQTAEGRKGECFRPNVNLLMSTTPRGFEDGVTLQAIEKGLLGRTLVFLGDNTAEAARLRGFNKLDTATKDQLVFWAGYEVIDAESTLGNITQMVQSLDATEKANTRLDEIFEEFDLLRRETAHDSPELPIIARLFQMTCKLSMLHAFSKASTEVPKIDSYDIEFAYSLVNWNFKQFKTILRNHIHANKQERDAKRVLTLIRESSGVTHQELVKKTRFLKKKQRQEIITDLLEEESIYVTIEQRGDKSLNVYKVGNNE